jgi:phosphatidate cytidylyltransferase
LKRITSAIILIALLLLLLYRGSVFHFWLLYLGVVVLALDEYYQLLSAGNFPCFRWSGIGGGVILSIFFLLKGSEFVGFALAVVFLLLCLRVILSSDDLKHSLEGLAVTFCGVFYVAFCLGHLVWLRGMQGGANLILYCLILLWANDTGAYYVGSRYGVTKMAPVLSPGKTWEGFFGGFLLTLVTAWLGMRLLAVGGAKTALVLVGLVSLIGPVGDLFESLIKRASGKKDSGKIIPGHGGLLDRIDSLIFCAPFFYYYCRSLF